MSKVEIKQEELNKIINLAKVLKERAETYNGNEEELKLMKSEVHHIDELLKTGQKVA